MDRIVVVGNADEGYRRCVACGYSDATPPGAGTLPGTRFSKPPASDGDRDPQTHADRQESAEISRVKIMDPLPPKG